MKIKKAEFLMSNTRWKECPKPTMPEYAFIGRSNVGKSSLINMLCDNKKLAKTSSTPGKTQLINHFLINESWLLCDLPGYGYAKVSKRDREDWRKMIRQYLFNRENLMNVFVLLDSRVKPQQIDVEFMMDLGENEIPFSIIFTKADKLKPKDLTKNIKAYKEEILMHWEELPPNFITSSEKKKGKEELLAYINEINAVY
jgi:GTP-binding protein